MATRRRTAPEATQKKTRSRKSNPQGAQPTRRDSADTATTRPAARLSDETLIALIEDVRAKPRRAPEEAEAYERSLAELVAEAACRNLLACITLDLEQVRARAQKVDQEKIRGEIQQAATLQQLQPFATHLQHADLNGLWVAFRCADRFQDDNEKLLALEHIIYWLSWWLLEDNDHVEQMEMYRTEQLAQSSAPVHWLEHEIRRLFHRTLEKAGNPTQPASAAAEEEEEL